MKEMYFKVVSYSEDILWMGYTKFEAGSHSQAYSISSAGEDSRFANETKYILDRCYKDGVYSHHVSIYHKIEKEEFLIFKLQ